MASAAITLALRDGEAARLDEDAERLALLLEGARAEARATGMAARWEPLAEGAAFRFVGLDSRDPLPSHWLHRGTRAEVVGARAVVLGPEPVIGAQRIVLHRADRQLAIATDGLGPFAIASP